MDASVGISREVLEAELAGLCERQEKAYQEFQQICGARQYCQALLNSVVRAGVMADKPANAGIRMVEGDDQA